MIDLQSLKPEWIAKIANSHRKADKILVEKVIRALLLLEGLVEQEIPFVFKGGTALMLLLNATKRFSIDIDIIIPKKDPQLDEKLAGMIERKGFSRLVIQHRKSKSTIQKVHYKFYYRPAYFGGRNEDHILLDVLFEEVHYQLIKPIDIASSFVIQTGAVVQVSVPSFEDLVGDKLTAFAPQTTGIAYQKGGQSRAMEIIKQLYDIGNMFDQIEDLTVVRKTFIRFAVTEMAYRDLGNDPQIVLDDIFQTALTISTRAKEGTADFEVLKQGISRVKAFIFSESYHIEKAIAHAAKAAYLTKLIETKQTSFERFSEAIQIKDWLIKQPFYTRLNKLRKSNPEAFFYWYKVYELVV